MEEPIKCLDRVNEHEQGGKIYEYSNRVEKLRGERQKAVAKKKKPQHNWAVEILTHVIPQHCVM